MDLRTFITAGNATFTVTSRKTGTRFTYTVRAADENRARFFVSVLTGPDNEQDYSYAGMLFIDPADRWTARQTRGSKVRADATSWLGFQWLVRELNAGRDFERHAEVHHQGRCGRCGRALTVPESIESGFGPECISKV